MLLKDFLVSLLLCLPGIVMSRITLQLGVIMPNAGTAFNVRDFKKATFSTYMNSRMNKTLKKYFDIERGLWIPIAHFSPQEILKAFCEEVLEKNINAIVIYNNPYFFATHKALEGYVFQLAGSLGIPILSWNAQYSIADQVSQDAMILEFAPSIEHQVDAMLSILKQYQWPAFSIVTTTLGGYKDFINLLRDKSRSSSQWYGIADDGSDIIRRFEIISELVLTNRSIPYLYRQMSKLKKSDTRIVLLYANKKEARDIMMVATNLSLTDPRYMWVVTQATVERLGRAPTEFPKGMLGIQFAADKTVVSKTLEVAFKIWNEALKKLAGEGLPMNTLKPNMTCSSSSPLTWKDGKTFFEYLKNATVEGTPDIVFNKKGMLKYTKLNITNLKENGRWTEIGNWDKNGLVLKDITWPGGKKTPPSGKPSKYHMKVLTLEEEPYVKYSHLEEDGTCGKRKAFLCRVGRKLEDPRTKTKYINGTEMKCCQGLAIDLLGMLNRTLGFDFTLYEVDDAMWGNRDKKTKQWNGLVRALMDLKGDMVITSLKITPERSEMVEFSTPFLETGITIIVAIREGAISATAFLGDRCETISLNEYDKDDTGPGMNKPRAEIINIRLHVYASSLDGRLPEPFDITSWILILLLCIHVVSILVFTFEWSSPSGLNKGLYVGEPYDFPSWCLILVFSVHAIGASIFIFEWLSPQGLNQGKTPMREHKFSLFRSFWLIWSMLFQATVTVDNPRGVSSRFLANVWALFALVFLASYTANLAAFMITKEEYWDLSGITDERLQNPTILKPPFRFATVPNGSTEANIMKTDSEMYDYMKQFNESNVRDGIEAVKHGKIDAFIYDATVLEYRAGKDKKCKLRTVGDWYARTGYGVAFPFGSKWIEPVNQAILQFQENGELQRLQRFWMTGACSKNKKKGESSHKLGIPNFTSAFILLLGGMLLGVVLLTVEHSYFKFGRGCLRKWDKCGCCGLVSLSMGKSLTFEQSVMDAIEFSKSHKCKDPKCETQLWKVRHELDLALLKIDRLQGAMADSGVKSDDRAVWRLENQDPDRPRPNRIRLQPNGMARFQNRAQDTEEPGQSRAICSAGDMAGQSNKLSPQKGDYGSGTWPVRRSPSYTSAIFGADRSKSPTKVRYHNGNYYVEVDDKMEMETVL